MKNKKGKETKTKLKTIKELEKLSIRERHNYLVENQSRYPNEELNGVVQTLYGATLYENNEETEKELVSIYGKTKVREEKRQIWEVNHTNILNQIHISLYENSHFPTVTQIAEKTKLSRTTVHKHLKSFDKSDYYKDRKQKMLLSIERMLASLYYSAMNYGNEKSKSMFLKYATKFVEKDTPKAPPTTFIQVNNIYVNQDTFLNLAPSKREQIEKILLSDNVSDNSPIPGN